MERHHVLTITEAHHPDPDVQRLGFELHKPYVELCWGPVLGPTATLLLRRLPVLWQMRRPATIAHAELAGSLGLGLGAGSRSRLIRAMDRCVRFGVATWTAEGTSLAVYGRLPALSDRQLARLPEFTRRAHQQIFDAHLDAAGPTRPSIEAMTRRLDRLQRPTGTEAAHPATRTHDADR